MHISDNFFFKLCLPLSSEWGLLVWSSAFKMSQNDNILNLFCSQLKKDGYRGIAQQLAAAANVRILAPSNDLLHIISFLHVSVKVS